MKLLARSILNHLEKICRFKSVRGHTFWIVPLTQDSTIIDLGANRGDFAVTLAALFNCKVYAVEPNPDLLPSSNLLIDRLAITGQSGVVKFNVSDNPEASSLYSNLASTFGTKYQLEVRALTLTEYLAEKRISSHISVLKLDIEGGEIEVLETLKREELENIDQITVEFHIFLDPSLEAKTREIIDKLKSLGFVAINCNYPYYDDFLFINSKILKRYKFLYVTVILMKVIYQLRGIFHQVARTSKAFRPIY